MKKNALARLRPNWWKWLRLVALALACCDPVSIFAGSLASSDLTAVSPAPGRFEAVTDSFRSHSLAPPLFPRIVGGSFHQKVTAVHLPPAALSAAQSASAIEPRGRFQIGQRRPLTDTIAVTATTAPENQWTLLPNGSRLWAIEVSSGGALGVRVHLENVSLPEGAFLLVYDASNPPPSVRPFSTKDLSDSAEAWAETVFAERVVVECQVLPGVDLRKVKFTIAELSHIYQLPPAGVAKEGTCENDVTCYPDWAREASGTARILFVDGGNTYLCTGCLINPNDPASSADYFLTANHCIGNQAVASTLELFWFYQTSTCNGPVPALASVPHTAGGADLLSGSSLNDFAFLRLRRARPSGAARLNWAASRPGVGDGVTAIHHPGAAYKRISFGNVVGTDGSFWQVQWKSGVTEPGSSGSPLFNGSHQVIGQLYGGNSSCTVPDGVDVFGRFDLTYNSIKAWIDPSGSATGNSPPSITIPRGATYYGLFQQDGASPQNSGAVVLTTAAKGRFTASIRLASSRFSVSGQFNSLGQAEVSVPNRNITLNLQLDPNDTDNLSGQLSTSSWSAALAGNRATFSAASEPAPMAGRYTLSIAGGSDPAAGPAGNSYGTVVVDASGRVNVVGRLADGTPITQFAVLSKTGLWPFYVPLYSGLGAAVAWLNMGTSPGDITGTVGWNRPPLPNARTYPNGFVLQAAASGSPYAPPAGQKQLLNLGAATLVFDGANLSFDVSLSKNKARSADASKLSLTFAPGTGAFSGRAMDPYTGKWIPFAGTVLQNRNLGAGYYLNANQAGAVWLRGK